VSNYKILATDYYTPPAPGKGVWEIDGVTAWYIVCVAIETAHGKWKAYIGFANTVGAEEGAQQAARNGVKLSRSAALGHFPELDSNKFVFNYG